MVFLTRAATVIGSLAIALFVAGPVGAAAEGQGGVSVASAPTLPAGQHIESGWANQSQGEFWRIPVRSGDRLTFDYGTATGCGIALYIYRPDVTDYTLSSASSVASASTGGKEEFIWVAPRTGSWIINFRDCSTNSYEFTVVVRRFAGLSTHGGDSIRTAPLLPLSRHAASGWANQSQGEFWRLSVRAGWRFTLDYGASTGCGVAIYIYEPSVTDYTVSRSNSVASDSTGGKARFSWVAPHSGRWILNVRDCSSNAYEFTARVRLH
jgi:hypothetical protein